MCVWSRGAQHVEPTMALPLNICIDFQYTLYTELRITEMNVGRSVPRTVSALVVAVVVDGVELTKVAPYPIVTRCCPASAATSASICCCPASEACGATGYCPASRCRRGASGRDPRRCTTPRPPTSSTGYTGTAAWYCCGSATICGCWWRTMRSRRYRST